MQTNFHPVELDIKTPDPVSFVIAKEHQHEEQTMTIPGVLKMVLTEKSERNIFGNVSPYRTAMLPPLPWGNEKYYESKLAVIDEDETLRYNAIIERKYKKTPDEIEKKKIKPGIVEVFRASHNVRLTNVEQV